MQAVRVAVAVAAIGLVGGVHAQSLDDLLKKNGCTACHAVDKKVIGPAYVDVAAKYKGDAKAPTYLFNKIKQGGSGVWGQIPMPPNTQASDADVKKIVDDILKLKK
ncbi:MAG TPA: c-type cytochrome [Casimicrobiaceae bacterium]|jgi:cytochrome c|nr:c-type cytochrome [Casimicrobiaceae bacterium]